MRFRTISLVFLAPFLVLLACLSSYAQQEPIEGENYIWIDLGDEDEGVLLTLASAADGITEPDDVAGVECKLLPYPYDGPGHNHMYFDIADTFIGGGDYEVWIVMEYFDSGVNIDCQYDSNGVGPVDGAFRGAGDGAFPQLVLENTETWRIHIWHITDGRFSNRGNGHDFRFSTHAAGDMWVNRLWIFLYEPPDPFNPDDIGRPQAVQPEGRSATTWGLLKESL